MSGGNFHTRPEQTAEDDSEAAMLRKAAGGASRGKDGASMPRAVRQCRVSFQDNGVVLGYLILISMLSTTYAVL
jgi:hypothetical protein